MIHFIEHIPPFCSGFEKEEFDVETLEELLEKEDYKLKSNQHKLVWAYAEDNTLMISSTTDIWYWVVGFVSGIDLSEYLPYYNSCCKTPLDARVKVVKLNPDYYTNRSKKDLNELYIVEGTTKDSDNVESYAIRSLIDPKNAWAWAENEKHVLFVRYATPNEIEFNNKAREGK